MKNVLVDQERNLNFVMVMFKPRASRIVANEEAQIPFPKEDTTPPVIKINLAIENHEIKKRIFSYYTRINS